MQHIDRLKLYTIDGAGGSVAVAKSSQLHEEKGSGAPRGVIRRPAGVGRGARGAERLGGAAARGARARSPRAAPLASRQSPADSACACVTRAAPCTALVLRTRRVPPRCGREPRPLRYRRIVSPNLRATCYVLTYGHFTLPYPACLSLIM